MKKRSQPAGVTFDIEDDIDSKEDEDLEELEDEEKTYEIGLSDFLYIVGLFCLGIVYVLLILAAVIGAAISKGLVHFMIDQISTNPRKVGFCNNDQIIPDTSKKYYVDWSREDFSIITTNSFAQISGTDQPHLLETEQIAWIWCLFFSFAIPEAVVFVKSLMEILLKNSMVVSHKISFMKQLGVVLLLEAIHTIGLALLFFTGLPQVDTIQAVAVSSCICLFPFVLSCVNKYVGLSDKSQFKLLPLDILAILAQLSGIFVWPYLTGRPNPFSLTLSLFLTSFAWWESYVSVDKKNLRVVQILVQIKHAMNNGTRYWIYMIVSLFKIGIFLAMMVILCYSNNLLMDPLNLFTGFERSFAAHFYKVREALPPMIGENDMVLDTEYMALFQTTDFFPLWVLLIQIGASFLTYGISIFVCKVRLQQLIFALPMSLTSPVLLNSLFIMCGYQIEDPCASVFPRYLFFQCPPLNDSFNYIWSNGVWLWLVWFMSQLWITKHIWNSATIRLASIEQLFCKPLYIGLMLDQSLVLNKRNDAFQESVDEKVTIIYGCVTLWHETITEMQSLITSIVRMDSYHNTQKFIAKHKKDGHTDYFEWETHIIFDDAFHYPGEDGTREKDDNIIAEVGTINTFVHNLMDILDKECATPVVAPTPYGGRIVWTLPLGTKIICHLKDKYKIKNKKRWSQIMYMNYLLTYKHKELMNKGSYSLENTYLLALDGDMDFRPEAVTMLLDLMKKNEKTGAVCGRIHPLGSGLMKWYQSFEYAIGHWLQKSTEHVMGCVLCSPGCFSLFRASCIHGDIMKTYATVSTNPKDFVQYDQGEDRWLCTLLLQNGFRVAYAAACDAYTFVPETFDDFFKQRRRWMPSTMANIVDLLNDYKNVVRKNKDISYFYIAYQLMLLVGTILGPGTIFLMLVGSVSVAFKLSNIESLVFNIIPIFAYMAICYQYSSNDKIQLTVAQFLSFFYTLVMMAVLVGIMLQVSEDGWLAPTTLSLLLVASSFIISAVAHPKEILCLPCGLIYYVTIPAMYLLLVIYSIFNLNVISWGTRETSTGSASEEKQKNSWKESIMTAIFKVLKRDEPPPAAATPVLESSVAASREDISPSASPDPWKDLQIRRYSVRNSLRPPVDDFEEDNDDEEEEISFRSRNYLKNPLWMDNKQIKQAQIQNISQHEVSFWTDLIKTYLTPDLNSHKILEERKQVNAPVNNDANNALEKKKGLEALRNQVVLTFIIINSLFVVTVFLLQQQKNIIYINWPLDATPNITFVRYQNSAGIDISYDYLKLEPIGLVFIVFFASVLIVQLIGMFAHRILTFMHILSMHPIKKYLQGDLSFVNQVTQHLQQTHKTINDDFLDIEEKKAIEEKRNQVFMRRLSLHPQYNP